MWEQLLRVNGGPVWSELYCLEFAQIMSGGSAVCERGNPTRWDYLLSMPRSKVLSVGDIILFHAGRRPAHASVVLNVDESLLVDSGAFDDEYGGVVIFRYYNLKYLERSKFNPIVLRPKYSIL